MSESYAVSEKRELLLERVRKFILDNGGIVKKSQLAGLGIDYRRILDFVEKGDILRIKSGYYAVHLSDFTEEELVAKLFPDCVLNLENALYAYGYIKKKPYGWRLAVDKNTSKSRFKMDYPKIIPVLFLTLGFGIIGFLDDYLKVVLKRSDGLLPWQKFLLQVVLTAIFVFYIVKYTDISLTMRIPFWSGHFLNLGWLAVPVLFFAVIGTVNGVNFTDGLDGLASSVTLIVAVFFTVASLAKTDAKVSKAYGLHFCRIPVFLLPPTKRPVPGLWQGKLSLRRLFQQDPEYSNALLIQFQINSLVHLLFNCQTDKIIRFATCS